MPVEEGGGNDHKDINFGLTPASRLLLKDEPLNLRQFVLFVVDPSNLNPWQSLGDWFVNNDPTLFYTAYRISIWKYAENDLGFQDSFNEFMAVDSRLLSKVLTEEFKGMFEGLTSLMDVGGGTGLMAKTIAQTFPHLRCICFDLPHIATNLKGSEKLGVRRGNMFDAIPTSNAI